MPRHQCGLDGRDLCKIMGRDVRYCVGPSLWTSRVYMQNAWTSTISDATQTWHGYTLNVHDNVQLVNKISSVAACV
jgi:hypothetical protein